MPTISDVLPAGISGALLPEDGSTADSRWSIPCHDGDPEIWFADTPIGVEHAKALCGGCPLKVECLQGALERAEPWGVWGGELFDHGLVIPRKRPRGRPRKSEVA